MEIILRAEAVEQAQAGDKCDFTGTLIVVPDVAQLSTPGKNNINASSSKRRVVTQKSGNKVKMSQNLYLSLWKQFLMCVRENLTMHLLSGTQVTVQMMLLFIIMIVNNKDIDNQSWFSGQRAESSGRQTAGDGYESEGVRSVMFTAMMFQPLVLTSKESKKPAKVDL